MSTVRLELEHSRHQYHIHAYGKALGRNQLATLEHSPCVTNTTYMLLQERRRAANYCRKALRWVHDTRERTRHAQETNEGNDAHKKNG
jgi:hypothetical protein